MNHIYRLVWNKKRHMLMAVAEVGSTQGKEAGENETGAKPQTSRHAGPGARTVLAAALLATFSMVAHAQSSRVIDAGTTEYLSDSDSSNADIASFTVHNNGTLDIAGTDYGTSILGLAGVGTVQLGDRQLTVTNAFDFYEGTIVGNGGFVAAGGTQVLSGTNTYGGATAIGDGATLMLSGSGSIALSSGVINQGTFNIEGSDQGAQVQSLSGSGTVLLGGQTLTLTNAHDTFTGVIQGWNGGLTLRQGFETLSGANTYGGATTVERFSTLALSGSGSIAQSSGLANNGIFDIAATTQGAQVQSLAGSGAVLLGGQTLTLTNAHDTFAGAIHGSGGLAVAGGIQILSGTNTYSGATSVEQFGQLSLSGSGSIALSSGLANNGVFDIATTTQGAWVQSLSGSGSVLLGGQTLTLTNAHDTFAGAFQGSGGLVIAGGEQVLTGTNSNIGSVTIGGAGQLSLAGAGKISSSTFVNDGVFDIAATDQGANLSTLSGSGTVLLGDQTLTLSRASGTFAGTIHGSGGLVIASGTEVLSGRNTYSGATTIANGSLLGLAGAGSIAESDVFASGTLDVSASDGSAAVKSLRGSGLVLLGGQTLSVNDAAGTFAGTIMGSGGLAIAAGTQVLDTRQFYSGTTAISQGATLALGANGGVGSSTVINNGVFDISASETMLGLEQAVAIQNLSGSGTVLMGTKKLSLQAAAGDFAGTLVGSGDLSVRGKLSLSGDNLNTGRVMVMNGTLRTTTDANAGRGNSPLELYSGTWATGANQTYERGVQIYTQGTAAVDAGTTTTLNAAVTGSGIFVKQGDGTLVLRGVLANNGGLKVERGTLALGAANTFEGATTVYQGGTLRIASDANLGAAQNRLYLDGGTLQTSTSMDSARAILITKNGGTFDTEGADSVVTLNGNLSGAGRVIKEGAGTLVLGGDNGGGKGSANKSGDGWTGGLTVNDGLVKVTHAYGLGWGSVLTFNGGTIQAMVDIATGQDIRMGRSTNIHTDANTVTTLSGDLLSTGAGNGCFTKSGLGTLNVTGNASIDATCVQEGKLLANGTFDSKVTVARGATLGGAGTIKGDLLVQGTLAPGNSPGMLTADANVTMARGSTYKEDIGGSVQASSATPVGAAGYYSYLHVVNGKRFIIEPGATLAPALKNLYTQGEAGYGSAPLVPQLGQTFRIVTADGGITGRFDTLAQPDGMDGGTRMAAFYNVNGNNSIELKVLPASYASWLEDGNANSRAVGAALDRIVELDASGQSSARQNALLYTAGSYDAGKLDGLVHGLSGQVHGALAAAAPQAGWDLQRSVLKHGAAQDGRALWLDITANRGKWSGDDGASGFHTDRLQATVGLDVLRTADSRVGVGFSHAHSDLSADDGKGKLRQNKLFAYGETAAGGLVFDAIGSVGRDKTESGRADPFAPGGASLATRGEGDSALLGVGVRAQREFRGTSIEPFARVTVQKIERDRLDEGTGSLAALALDDYSATGTRLVTGLSAASRNSDPLQASTYRFNLGVGVDSGDLVRPSQQAALAGVGFAVGAPDAGRGFVQGGVNGTLQLRKGAYLYFGLNGEARSSYYQAGGNAGVRAVF